MKNKNIFVAIVAIIIVIILALVLYFKDRSIPVDGDFVKDVLASHRPSKIEVTKNYDFFYMKNNIVYKVKKDSINLTSLNLQGVDINPKEDVLTSFVSSIFLGIVLLLVIAYLIYMYKLKRKINRKKEEHLAQYRSMINEGLKHKEDPILGENISMTKSNVSFDDVAGIKEVKEELLEVIDYLKNPKKYQDLNIKLPKGVLLVGPPGVGKTMIAKAVAGEAGVPFFYQSGSSFVQIYVGMGAKRVKSLFEKALQHAPSIIFIDEIDAVGKARGNNRNDEREATLNELLTQMDGFEERSGVIVIAATNQLEVLDSALLRSGRFDRRVIVDLPDLSEREEILKVYLKDKSYELDIKEVAKMCVGFSGASLSSLINEAALNALRHNRASINMQDITYASEKIVMGKKKEASLDLSQKKSMAIYNASKALSLYWLDDEFQKISLIQNVISSTLPNHASKSDILNKIKIALSGNLGLEVYNLEPLIAAKDDLSLAKNLAKQMCEVYGMASRLLTDNNDMLEILNSALETHKDFIYANKDHIASIASELLEKEKLTKADIAKIVG
ncbi:AAA family ATPase [Helicobacter sp. 13S00401-1]|uniref:AAA family ATPase n=1 Tax=Helicobacter sp. 13S00401-1 TaxID=1905758 RepID=UPI000BA5DE45|nr:AAA family ATPase [Helicobacter sp. 13S00401-1]